MIYTQDMVRWIAIFGLPLAVVVGLVELLNWLDAEPGSAVAALGLAAVIGGATLGYFADRLPALPRERRHHGLTPRHIDRVS